MRVLNLQKSPEKKTDWYYSTLVQAAANLPAAYSLEQYRGAIRDQGESGFCHSFAGAAAKNIHEYKEKGYRQDLSPLFIAKNVKAIDSFKNEEGSDILSVCKALISEGTMQETEYPFDRYRVGSLAFPAYTGTAARYKIKGYARLATVGDIKQALYMGKPVLLGIQCTREIYDVSKADPFIKLPERIVSIGGHAICVVGYDDGLQHDGRTGFLRIQNSWGTEWGDNGLAWLPYDYLTYTTKDTGARFLFMDAYTMVDLENDPIRETVIKMRIGDRSVEVNGDAQEWDVPPAIMGDRTMVPLRYVAELLGYAVHWDEQTKTVTLIKEG